jgi:peptide/nickel transport system substrate-binding protein
MARSERGARGEAAQGGLSRRDFILTSGKVLGGGMLTLSAADLLAACANAGKSTQTNQSNVAPVKGGTLIEGLSTDIAQVLNPVLNSNGQDLNFVSMLFDGLLSNNGNGDLIPMVAQSLPKVSSDGLTYTFNLRKDVTWSDGKPLTSDDVVFTYSLMLDPAYKAVRSAYRGDLETYVAAVQNPDPYTVVFKMKKIYAPFLALQGGHGIVPKHVLGSLSAADFNTAAYNNAPSVVNGAFTFVEWAKGDHLKLARNPKYYRGAAYLDGFVLKVLPNNATVTSQLETGDLHIARVAAYNTVAELKTKSNLSLTQFSQSTVGYYWYNLAKNNAAYKILSNKAVRQALMYAVDRQGIVDAVYFTYGAKLANSPILPESWAYNPNTTPKYTLDAAKAASMLDAEGWKKGSNGIREKDGVPMKLEITTLANNANYGGISQVLQQAWMQLGLQISIKAVPLAQLVSAGYTSRDFDVLVLGVNVNVDPDESNLWHSRNAVPGGQNIASYSNPTVDKILDDAAGELDQSKRKQLYYQLQKTIMDDLPGAPLIFQQGAWVYQNFVHQMGAGFMGPYCLYGPRPYMNQVFMTKQG